MSKTLININNTVKRKSALISVNYLKKYEYRTESEIIVSTILNKILSLSLRKARCERIYNTINEFCYSFIKSKIDLLIKVNYIVQNENPMLKNKESNLTDNNINTWVEIKEPESAKNDRFDSSKVNIIFCDKKNILNNKNIEVIENNKKLKKREFQIKIKKNPLIKIIEDDNHKRKIGFLPIQSYDIPNIDEEYNNNKYDIGNVKELRNDMMNNQLKKEKEKKKQLSKELEIKFKISKKNSQILDASKFTFDSNGNIFPFKKYSLDNNSKEFFHPNNKIKTLYIKEAKENASFKSPLKENDNIIIQSPNSRKTVNYEKENNYNLDGNYLFKKISPEKIGNEIIPSGNNYKLILPNVGVNIKYPNKKEKKGMKDFSEYFKKYTLDDYEKMLNEYVPKKNTIFFSSSFENSYSINNISNNNINTLNNNNNNNTLNNNINTSNNYNNNINTSNNNNNNNNNNNISNNNTSNNNNNNNNNTSNNNNNNNNNISNNNNNTNSLNKLNFNYYNDSFNQSLFQSLSSRTLNDKFLNDNLDNSSNLSSSRFISSQLSNKTIKLNPKINSSSLKLQLDNISNLNNNLDENSFLKKSITSRNVFKNKLYRHLSEKKDVSDINLFNSNIIHNKNWGKNNYHSNNNLSASLNKPSKPNRSSFLREFGRNILSKRIKLPRQRKMIINIYK